MVNNDPNSNDPNWQTGEIGIVIAALAAVVVFVARHTPLAPYDVAALLFGLGIAIGCLWHGRDHLYRTGRALWYSWRINRQQQRRNPATKPRIQRATTVAVQRSIRWGSPRIAYLETKRRTAVSLLREMNVSVVKKQTVRCIGRAADNLWIRLHRTDQTDRQSETEPTDDDTRNS